MVAYGFKKRFVMPIAIGLGQRINPEDQDLEAATMLTPKRQTIRQVGKRRHARVGDTLQLYTSMRTKQCRKIGEARCTAVHDIRLFISTGCVWIDGAVKVNGDDQALAAFAQDDGFASWGDMQEFWRKEHGSLARLGPFVGLLIRWEPLPQETTDA